MNNEERSRSGKKVDKVMMFVSAKVHIILSLFQRSQSCDPLVIY